MGNYEKSMPDERFEQLKGSLIGRGSSRYCYDVPSDPDVVIKEIIIATPAVNFIEWFIWCAVQQTGGELAGIMGKCLSISESGRFLMMEHLASIEKSDYADVPDVPTWLNDRKPSAFGKREGTIKVRDYGLVRWEDALRMDVLELPAFAVSEKIKRRFDLPPE